MDWKLRGLRNVKRAIKTRLTKESEEARTAIDDRKDELEEREEGESRTGISGYHHGRELAETAILSWEEISSVFGQQGDRQDYSDDEGSIHDQRFEGSRPDSRSPSATDWSSPYESGMESGPRSPQAHGSRSFSECNGDDESDGSPGSEGETPSDDGSSETVETQQEESVIGKTLSGTGFSTILSEKRKHYGTTDSGSDESDGPTG
ncbi:hypothetical protein BGX29_004311, partial [Mortierella sp. GBA35]